MKRPQLVHFIAIKTDEHIAIRASLTMDNSQHQKSQEDSFTPRFPIQAFRLLNAYEFRIKIVGLDRNQNEVFKKSFDSDSFGAFYLKIPLNEQRQKIEVLQVFEVGKNPGLEWLVGTFIPMQITNPKKIIICDFDKTLVETKYSNTIEMYKSLTKPLYHFPTLENSLSIFKRYIDEGYHPFVLSASPHFYEEAMRDWLYQNGIFTAAIFLKDYRKIFSFFASELTPKDLKIQGLYKLNHLLDILIMTGIPTDLIMMGDNFESDPVIYHTLGRLLRGKEDSWSLWNELKETEIFRLNSTQNSHFLNKIYQISSHLKRKKEIMGYREEIKIKILIRRKAESDTVKLPYQTDQNDFLKIQLYDGNIKAWLPEMTIKE